jgi:hypothetical protein
VLVGAAELHVAEAVGPVAGDERVIDGETVESFSLCRFAPPCWVR